MRKFKGLFYLLMLFFGNADSFSQDNKKVDSLLNILKTATEDTTRVNNLYALSGLFRYNNTDTAIYFANKALVLAERIKYEMGIANLKTRTGALYADQGRYVEGEKLAREALVLYDRLLLSATVSNKSEILKKLGSAYNVVGHNTIQQGNYPEALRVSFLALKVREEVGDKKGISDTEFNIGNIYLLQHNHAEALKYYYASLKKSEELGIKSDIAYVYNTIGWLFIEQGNYPEALKQCLAALKLAQEINDKFSLSEIYNYLGVLSEKQGNYPEALKYSFQSLKMYEQIGNTEQIAFLYNNIAIAYLKQRKYNNAFHYLNKALSVAKHIGHLEHIKLSYQNMATLDSAKGNYKGAFDNYRLFINYRDSLVNMDNTKKMVQQQMQYDFGKREDSLRQVHFIAKAKLAEHKRQLYFYWGGLALLVMLSFFVFLNFRNQKKINRLAKEAYARQKTDMELQHQNAVMQDRLRISRELHDEVGATLSGIAMYSHLAKEQIKNNKATEVEKSLNVMQQSSGEMVNRLNDIVWLVNPDQDKLQKLIERLEEYARNMAVIKNMQVKINIPEKISQINLPMESRRNIYLFFKEAINNAVKYSGGNLLELNIKEADGKLEFSVSDNGKGFDTVMVKRGNGLENMQKRADEINAQLILKSKLNEGVNVSMQYKIT